MSAMPMIFNGVGCTGCNRRFRTVSAFENPENHRGDCEGRQ